MTLIIQIAGEVNHQNLKAHADKNDPLYTGLTMQLFVIFPNYMTCGSNAVIIGLSIISGL